MAGRVSESTSSIKTITTALLLLTATIVPFVAAQGGGDVNNVVAEVTAFTNSEGGTANDGATDVFSGTVSDVNGEADIVSIRVATTSGPDTVSDERSLTGADVEATSEPGSFTSGWKVWNPTPDDGELSFKFEHTYGSSTGTNVWEAAVKDEDSYQVYSPTISVEVVLRISAASDPVGTDGNTLGSVSWGAWSADPGASNVAGENYVKVANTGETADQSFTLSFSSASFTTSGADDTIDIDGNIQFYSKETASGGTPGAIGTFGSTDADGEITLSFSDTTNEYYIAYRLVDLPATLVDQAYTAAYTVTAV